MTASVATTRQRLIDEGSWDLHDVPPVPQRGASEEELCSLESQLGVPLPAEYRLWLSRCRYLTVATGQQVWGFDHEGVTIGSPLLSRRHRTGSTFLIFGDCWNWADGDQLYFDLGDLSQAVYVYLHEHGPACEPYAPSFSLALYRLVHESP